MILFCKMADLLIEQSSLNTGLSKIGDELSIRRKASRRARIHFHIENAKKELKDERERCLQEFREEVRFLDLIARSPFPSITLVIAIRKSVRSYSKVLTMVVATSLQALGLCGSLGVLSVFRSNNLDLCLSGSFLASMSSSVIIPLFQIITLIAPF